MQNRDITTLELHGPSEAYVIVKAIEARMQELQDSDERDAIVEYLTLQQIAVRIPPQDDDRTEKVPVLQFNEEGWLL